MLDSTSTAQTNTLALVSVGSGAAAWVLGGLGSCATLLVFPPIIVCTIPLFFAGVLAATITGHMARNQIRESLSAQTGDGLATAGIVLGWGGLGLGVIAMCILPLFGTVILALLGPSIGTTFSNIIDTIMTATPAP
jgi:hypothetical protein